MSGHQELSRGVGGLSVRMWNVTRGRMESDYTEEGNEAGRWEVGEAMSDFWAGQGGGLDTARAGGPRLCLCWALLMPRGTTPRPFPEGTLSLVPTASLNNGRVSAVAPPLQLDAAT